MIYYQEHVCPGGVHPSPALSGQATSRLHPGYGLPQGKENIHLIYGLPQGKENIHLGYGLPQG